MENIRPEVQSRLLSISSDQVLTLIIVSRTVDDTLLGVATQPPAMICVSYTFSNEPWMCSVVGSTAAKLLFIESVNDNG